MATQDRLGIILGHVRKQPYLQPNFHSISVSSNSLIPDSYEYTLDNPRLNNAQRAFYEENGFLVIPDLVPHDLLDQCRDRFLDLINGKVEWPPAMTKMRDISLKGSKDIPAERIVNKIQDFVWDDILSQHCQIPEILDYVECFTGPNIMAMHTMLINKPPDPGTRSSRHPMHQDLHYFPFRPTNRIVCAWTAMEKINVNNGCLFVVPGSHKGKLEQHEYPEWEDGVNKMYHGVRGFDHHPKAMLEMEKGDTVFFHPLLLHGSGDNKTQRFRKAISCHYASGNSHWIDVRGTTQENIAQEVKEIARKRGLDNVEYSELWKYRSRCVRGEPVTLK